jgi:hypothetical protein
VRIVESEYRKQFRSIYRIEHCIARHPVNAHESDVPGGRRKRSVNARHGSRIGFKQRRNVHQRNVLRPEKLVACTHTHALVLGSRNMIRTRSETRPRWLPVGIDTINSLLGPRRS